MKRFLVGVAGVAVILGAMPAAGLVSSAQATAAAGRDPVPAERVRTGGPTPGVETVGVLPVRSDTAPALAELPESVAVVPGGRVVNPRTPLLHVPSRVEDAEVAIRIFDVSAGQSPAAESAWFWQGTLTKGWARVGEDLTPGHGYLVSGYKADVGEWTTLGSFTVSAAGRRTGPTTDVGGLAVSLLTGEVRWNWQSESLTGPADGVGVALSWVQRGTTTPGLPPGWQLSATAGSPWARLSEFGRVEAEEAAGGGGAAQSAESTCDAVLQSAGPRIVALTGWDGAELTFQRNADGVYRQVTGGVVVPGFANTLARCVGTGTAATWRFTDIDGTTTEFVNGRARRIIAQDQLIATLTWAGDRLEKVENAGGRGIDLVYAGGSGSCPSTSWSGGFAAPPSGMLCRINYPGDVSTDIGYQSAGLPAAQIALIKDPGNQGTTLGWTSRGVLYATRSPLVNLVAARNPDDGRLRSAFASVGYDERGRARTLRAAPATAGAATTAVLTHQLTLPVITERELRANAQVEAVVASTATGYSLRTTYQIGSRTGETLSSRDRTQAETTTIVDPKTGEFEGVRDPLGRETRYVVDEAGQLTKQIGPFTPGDATRRGMEQQFVYDSEWKRGEDVAVRGFRADIYNSDRFAGSSIEREFWRLPSEGDTEIRWRGRPVRFSARLAAVWTPTKAEDKAAEEAGGWDFEITVADGVQINAVIGAQTCPELTCRIRNLPDGDKPLLIEVLRAPVSGWITVSAAPAGQKVRPLPTEQVSPGFQRTTRVEFNDTYSGVTRDPSLVYGYDNLATDRPTSITQPGGLTATMEYEPSRPESGQWGRLTTYTTPGGLVQRTTYWDIRGVAALPSVCGAGQAVQAGQQRKQVRQDGSSVESFFDARGRLIASVVSGAEGGALTSCMAYRNDGSPSATSIWNASGELIERTEIEYDVDDDPLTTRTTVWNGPGAAVNPNSRVRSTTTANLLGLPVVYIDEHGTTTRTTYTPIGDPETVTVTPPLVGQPTMTMTYSYRETDAALTRVVLNGRTAAQLTYSTGDGRLSGIAYGAGTDAVGLSYEYTSSGQPRLLTAAGGGYRVRQEMTYTQYGRLLNSALRVTGAATREEARSYTYDEARRLTRAVITTDGAATDYRYRFAERQDAACGSAYPNASRDGLRTGGSRNGVDYVTCYDARGRAVSTTDPLLSGDGTGQQRVAIGYDNFGRVRTITGGAADVDMAWESLTEVARVADGRNAARVTTRMSTFADRIVAKEVQSSAGTATSLYSYTSPLDSSPTVLLSGQLGAPGAVQAYSLGLPGGANVTIPVGGTATMVVPGLDGAAAVAVPMPSFDLPVSGARDPAVGVGLLPRFGPYGEALEVPAAPRDAAPSYLWQAASRLETLGGPSSITLMGARPYLAALGLFLAVDPALNGGDALYGFTPGDPVNGVDSTGNANEWSWFWQIVSAVAVVASFVVGMLPGGQWAIPIALGMISTGAQILSAKTQTEPSPALDTFRSVQAWAGLAAMVVMIGPAVVKGVASAGKWTFGKIKAGVARFTRAAAPEANAASRASGSFAAASSASVRTSVEVVAKQGTLARLGAWLARANPKNAYWSGLDKAGKARSYVRSLGKLTGKMTFLGGAYGFQKFAESYVPPWLAAMMEQQQTATS